MRLYHALAVMTHELLYVPRRRFRSRFDRAVCRCVFVWFVMTAVLAVLGALFLMTPAATRRLPPELTYWPTARWLGGSGAPAATQVVNVEVLQDCPVSRPTWPTDGEGVRGILRDPRWIMAPHDCLDRAHLDAGVCVTTGSGREARSIGATSSRNNPFNRTRLDHAAAPPISSGTMRCLPSFLLVSPP